MNREIKFRAWHEGKIFENPDITSCLACDIPLMQYTGLKDKNGREIYEGDIVNQGTLGATSVVEWQALITNDGYSDDIVQIGVGFNIAPEEAPYFQIVGNVHENPELLGK